MLISKTDEIASLLLFALVSVFAYVLFEILAQYAFAATFEARFSGLNSEEVAQIEADARGWEGSSGSAEISISRGRSPDRDGYVNLVVSMKRVEQGFSTLAGFVSESGLDDYRGKLSLSREPSSLGRKVALLMSILVFLVLFRCLLMPKKDRGHLQLFRSCLDPRWRT